MPQNRTSGHEKSWLLRPEDPGAGRWLCFTAVCTLLACKTSPGPKNSHLLPAASSVHFFLFPDEPSILSILRNKYSRAHVYVGETIFESRRCFILFTPLKYFHSMDFDSHCSWFGGKDWILLCQKPFQDPYGTLNAVFANLHIDVDSCVRLLVSNVYLILTHPLVDLPKMQEKDLEYFPLFAMVQ